MWLWVIGLLTEPKSQSKKAYNKPLVFHLDTISMKQQLIGEEKGSNWERLTFFFLSIPPSPLSFLYCEDEGKKEHKSRCSVTPRNTTLKNQKLLRNNPCCSWLWRRKKQVLLNLLDRAMVILHTSFATYEDVTLEGCSWWHVSIVKAKGNSVQSISLG